MSYHIISLSLSLYLYIHMAMSRLLCVIIRASSLGIPGNPLGRDWPKPLPGTPATVPSGVCSCPASKAPDTWLKVVYVPNCYNM